MNEKDLTTPKLKNAEPLSEAAIDSLSYFEPSRRNFLKTAGIMMVGFTTATVAAPDAKAQSPINPSGSVDATLLDNFIAIGADDSITVLCGKCELGQGMGTLQLQLAAEELSVNIERINLIMNKSGITPNQGLTVGSLSTGYQFTNPTGLRVAMMTARDALNQLAAQYLDATLDNLTTTNGVISLKSDPTQKVSYGQLVLGKRFNLSLNPTAIPKDPAKWKVLGHSVPRADVPPKVKGTFQYVQKVRLPGMLHGKVVRPPTMGAHVVSVDKTVLDGLPGNPQAYIINDWVGVVADTEWHALQAVGALSNGITWSAGVTLPAQANLYDYVTSQPSQDAFVSNTGDVDKVVAGAAKVITAQYRVPYQMHGSLASSCAVADVRGGTGKTATCKVWSSTQGVYMAQSYLSGALGIPAGNIQVTYADGSGCYGHNGQEPATIDAALLSQAAGKPVRLQYTRRDEMTAGENYGHPVVGNQKVALDASGKIIAWDYEVFKLQKGEGATSAAGLGNSTPGFLAGYATSPIPPNAAPTNPSSGSNFGNWLSNYTINVFGGKNYGTGSIPSERVLRHTALGPFFTAWLRAPDGFQNSYIHEAFMDEVAASLKADPVQHRLRYLTDPRLINSLNLVTKKAAWDTRPSPKPGNARTGVVTGRGVSINLYGDNNGYTSMIAEVTVDQDSGVISVTKMTVSLDTGPVVHPDNLRNQMEGCALQGISRTLREEVKWNNRVGIITSGDWVGYSVLQFGDKLPVIDTILINNTSVPPTGAGEVVITVVGAAICNAVFDATGVRMRQIPFTPANFLAAKAAQGV